MNVNFESQNSNLPEVTQTLDRLGGEFQYRRVPQSSSQAGDCAAVLTASSETAVWGG